jgi:Fe-S cluster assembly protein SufD
MVFVNGRFAPQLSDMASLPGGVSIKDLGSSWNDPLDALENIGRISRHESHAFTALNTAFMHDGALIEIARDTEVARPIHLIYVADANAAKGMMHPRNLIHVGRNARATVIESYVSTSDAMYFTNAVTEVSLGDGATLQHYKIQREGARAYHVGTIEAHQSRDSHFISFALSTGAALSRTNVYTTLDGEGSGATLNGLYMLDGDQHCDQQTQITHAQPNCFSRELYKGVLDGQSHGVFNGKVYVHPIAQKTDGKQTNKTLLLSPTAQIDTKPQLEIFADDVKCTHGATIGQIDQTSLFYLKSRGIGHTAARRLLTYAFAADVLETIEIDEVRTTLEEATLQRFV